MRSKDLVTSGSDFERWIPLARQVVERSLGLCERDVFEIYTYVPTISLAEALALEARRKGSDTHLTLMTDDLWFTSMQELPERWLRAPSDIEFAINRSATADIYLGGPRDVRRMRDISPTKFEANTIGNIEQEEPKRRRKVRHVDLPIGRLCLERAEAYGLNYQSWERSYSAALGIDLQEIQKAGNSWSRKLSGKRKIRITSDAGTSLRFETPGRQPMVEDGIISSSDIRRGFVETSLPAGKIVAGVLSGSAEGKIVFTDPVFLMGRTVKGLHMNFRRGRLVDWGADENAGLLADVLQARGARGQVGWFTIGLNSAAEPCMLDNSIVENDVGIGLGHHLLLERPGTKPSIQFYSTIGLADIEILH